MTSIMQKISEDVTSVIEYMANGMPTIRIQSEDKIFVLTLTVADAPTEASE